MNVKNTWLYQDRWEILGRTQGIASAYLIFYGILGLRAWWQFILVFIAFSVMGSYLGRNANTKRRKWFLAIALIITVSSVFIFLGE